MTSGACGPGLSLLALMASISSPEPPSGLSSLIVRPYFAVKVAEHLAVVAPGVRQGDGRQLPSPLAARSAAGRPRRCAAADAPDAPGRGARRGAAPMRTGGEDEGRDGQETRRAGQGAGGGQGLPPSSGRSSKDAGRTRCGTRVLLNPRLAPGDSPVPTAVRDARSADGSVPLHWTARAGGRQDGVRSLLTSRERNDSPLHPRGRVTRAGAPSPDRTGARLATVAARSTPNERTATACRASRGPPAARRTRSSRRPM